MIKIIKTLEVIKTNFIYMYTYIYIYYIYLLFLMNEDTNLNCYNFFILFLRIVMQIIFHKT